MSRGMPRLPRPLMDLWDWQLQAACRNEMGDGRRKPAPYGSGSEHHDAYREDPATAVEIAKGSPGQQQCRKRQSIEFHHPLNLCEVCIQGGLQRRKSHVHDRAVNERHAGTENGYCQYPATAVGEGLIGGGHQHRCFVARRLDDVAHSAS